jgi:hypothetical protein
MRSRYCCICNNIMKNGSRDLDIKSGHNGGRCHKSCLDKFHYERSQASINRNRNIKITKGHQDRIRSMLLTK